MLLECANRFNELMNYRYNLTLGKKGKLYNISIVFDCTDFHHLLGLYKLKDLVNIATGNRKTVLNDICDGKITENELRKSVFYNKMSDRILPLSNFEKILDSNKLVFAYLAKNNNKSKIEADYLLSTPLNNTDIYIFLSKINKTRECVCRSFFPKTILDYTKGQPEYKLLYKEKIHVPTGEKIVQLDKLSQKIACEVGC